MLVAAMVDRGAVASEIASYCHSGPRPTEITRTLIETGVFVIN